jgi:hypothetical protein
LATLDSILRGIKKLGRCKLAPSQHCDFVKVKASLNRECTKTNCRVEVDHYYILTVLPCNRHTEDSIYSHLVNDPDGHFHSRSIEHENAAVKIVIMSLIFL